MAIRIILKDSDPVLREKAKPIPSITPNVQKLLDDMTDTMYENAGVGLAAPQIGILKRAIVMDCGEEHGGLIQLINPEIVSKEGEQFGREGCLSVSGLVGDVRRAQKCAVKGLDRDGKEVVIEGTDLLARCIQHEVDHLNGVLFTDVAERIYRPEEEPEE